jgi:hypothetical protein
MSNQTKKSSPLAMALCAALGLVAGLAIAGKLKLPKLSEGG